MKIRAAVVAIALALALSPPAAADATSDPDTGVWWQLNNGAGVTPPPVVDLPEGGLWLDSGPTGTTAVSAVRFEVADRQVAEAVTLRLQQDSSTPALGLRLCAAGEWTEPRDSPGEWEDRATPDCDERSFSGVVTADGAAVSFTLSGFGAGEDVDLVLARLADDTRSYISVTFQKPSASDLRTGGLVGGGGAVDPTPTPSTTASPTTTRPTSTFTPAPASNSGSSSRPPVATDPAIDTGGPAPIVDTTPPVTEPPIGSDEVAQPAVASRLDDGTGSDRLIGLVGLGLIGTWGATIVSRRITGGEVSSGATLYKGASPIEP